MRAPKHCGITGCTQLVRPGQRCPEHRTGWATSLPTASSKRTNTTHWKQQRAKALQRDNHQCVIRGPRCTITATEVDHIISVANGGTDELHNLASTCHNCNTHKTAREAAAGRT